ncbi:MAG: hypothetical protein C4325_09525 [Blastocatellia bacterium]
MRRPATLRQGPPGAESIRKASDGGRLGQVICKYNILQDVLQSCSYFRQRPISRQYFPIVFGGR